VENPSLINKIRSPKRSATSKYKRAAMFLALIQIKIPSERKIKRIPKTKRIYYRV
jgi:hypothetical protein